MRIESLLLALISLVVTTGFANGNRLGNEGAAPDTASMAQRAATQATPIDGADFILEEQPPLEKKVELSALPQDKQKAIYREMKTAMEETSKTVLRSGLSADEAFVVMERVQNKAKYQLGLKYGLTIEQLDQLNVYGMRFGW